MKHYFEITYPNGNKRTMWGTLEQCIEYCKQFNAAYKQK